MGVALIKFSDGLNAGTAGRAFLTASGQDLVIENDTSGPGSSIASWRITLAFAPVGTARERRPFIDPLSSWVIEENANGDTPSATLTNLEAGFPGSYRIILEVWTDTNFKGIRDVDIRNAIILTPISLLVIPPYQKDPDPLPLEGVGAKPDEMNLEDQRWGWAGPDYDAGQYPWRMVSEALKKLDNVPTSGVPDSRQVIAGAGLTGGGDLSVDRTFNVVANADGTIVVNSNDIQVGDLPWTKLFGVGTDILEPSGWPVPGDANDADATLSYVNATRTFSLTHLSDFNVYVAGTRVTVTGTLTKQWPDTAGTHFFYIDAAGVLQTTMSETTWVGVIGGAGCPVASLTWHSSGVVTSLIDERHGLMDGETHKYLHQTQGSKWIRGGGGALSGFTFGNGSLDVHAQFDVEQVLIRDEDILKLCEANGLNTFSPLVARTWAKVGAEWVVKDYDAFPGVMQSGANYTGGTYTGASGRVAWNEITAGVGALTEATNSDFVLAHVFATTEASGNSADGGSTNWGVEVILGQGEYDNTGDLEEGALLEVRNLVLAGLPFQEFVFLGSVAFQTNSGYGNSVKARTVEVEDVLGNTIDYVDLRDTGIGGGGGGGGGVTDHGLLTGLADDDHTQYLLQDGTRQAAYLDSAAYVTAGTTPALSGTFRGPNAGEVRFRNWTNSGDIRALTVGVTNLLQIGDSNTGNVFINGTGALQISIDAGTRLLLQAGLATFFTNVKLADGYISVSATPAQTGAFRLANNTGIYWRNAANNSDLAGIVCTGADIWEFAGGFFNSNGFRVHANGGLSAASYVQAGSVPASSGAFRLANNETISWRNTANSSDLPGIQLVTGDIWEFAAGFVNVQLGRFHSQGGLSANTYVQAGSNPAQSGAYRLPNASWIAGRNAANSADINALRVNTSNVVEIGTSAVVLGTVTVPNSAPFYSTDNAGTGVVPLIRANTSDEVEVGAPTGVAPLQVETQLTRFNFHVEMEQEDLSVLSAPTGTEGQLVYDDDGNLYFRTATSLTQLTF